MIKKFRIWNHQLKTFWYGGLREIYGHLPNDVPDNQIQQWTGLTDSQGVEIYEGDIVDNLCRVDCAKFGDKIIEGCIPSHFSIEKSVFKEVKCVKDTAFNTVNLIGYYRLKTTVIGNIFENPELLEKC